MRISSISDIEDVLQSEDMMGEGRLTDEQLQDIYTWVDKVPLSRPKRSIARDFSDGVLFAEVIHHYHPRLVDLHNFSPANSLQAKMYNWRTLGSEFPTFSPPFFAEF